MLEQNPRSDSSGWAFFCSYVRGYRRLSQQLTPVFFRASVSSVATPFAKGGTSRTCFGANSSLRYLRDLPGKITTKKIIKKILK